MIKSNHARANIEMISDLGEGGQKNKKNKIKTDSIELNLE